MGRPTGFLEIERRDRPYEKPEIRGRSWKEFVKPLPDAENRQQAARCMDCGIPFCHQGCPVNNMIPDWNNLVHRDQWRAALETLHSTNNFPEFTGRVCPAPCEAACTLNIDDNPVTIKTIECAIVDRGLHEGWFGGGGMGGGVDRASSTSAANRQAGRGRRLRPSRACLCTAADARGTF